MALTSQITKESHHDKGAAHLIIDASAICSALELQARNPKGVTFNRSVMSC
jgi:hypothetical protein